jgi:GNAT superfamily N-acetyltransferase
MNWEWGTDRAVVHDLEVADAHRSRGVGRTLMLELEDRVRARALSEIGLGTGLGEGYATARHLYRSLGYAERPDTTYIESSRSPWEPGGEAYVEIVTNWFRTLPY